ncbi:TPA: type VI secretion system protein TssA [Pasteurella multocida]|nr:type VI secretion system protein TssA [Pasteurella multocida]
MELLTNNSWRNSILATIAEEAKIDDDPEWVELDGDMVKLGSLEHETLNIPKLQQIALSLLSSKSKDLRIIAHLLRTLQHSAKPTELLLAVALLADYIEKYWQYAPPMQKLKKERLTLQILKRFDNAASSFNHGASRLEKDQVKVHFERLINYWRDDSKLQMEVINLNNRYTFVEENTSSEREKHIDAKADHEIKLSRSTNSNANKTTSSLEVADQVQDATTSIVSEPIEIDLTTDRAWKNTLLKVADHLIERDYSAPIGYQLRRFAIWNAITLAPPSENGKTQLAAISLDRVNEYKMAIENEPSITLWKNIEYSLTLAPFWIEGHYLSAKLANKFGLTDVAIAIKEIVLHFVTRLPELKQLAFSDGSLFIPIDCAEWLDSVKKTATSLATTGNQFEREVSICYENQGLSEALRLINDQPHDDMRSQAYAQLMSIDLLEKSGLHNLAGQQAFSLEQALLPVMLKDWEPSLFTILKNKQKENS